MNNTPRFGFVIEYVKDIEVARRFYVEVLGLEVERAAPTFIQFQSFAIASDQPLGRTGEPELYWLVDDAEAAFAKLSPGATVSLPVTHYPFGTAFAIEDPDGRPRYLLELAAVRPSTPAR